MSVFKDGVVDQVNIVLVFILFEGIAEKRSRITQACFISAETDKHICKSAVGFGNDEAYGIGFGAAVRRGYGIIYRSLAEIDSFAACGRNGCVLAGNNVKCNIA